VPKFTWILIAFPEERQGDALVPPPVWLASTEIGAQRASLDGSRGASEVGRQAQVLMSL